MKSTNSLHKTFWQNPYVDVFKHFPISEKANADKQGEISEQHDKQLAKKVIKISGAISGANYINLPSKKGGSIKSLGLNGRYFILECLVPVGSIFSVHLDYKVLNKTLKLSISNLFKAHKVISENNVQIPFAEPLAKWSIIYIDAKSILREILEAGQEGKSKTISLPETKDLDIELLSLQLCAKMLIRGVYTTDTVYTPKTLPKDIALRVPKNETFEQNYNWYTMNSFQAPVINAAPAEPEKENMPQEANTTKTFSIAATSKAGESEIPKKSILKKTQPQRDTRSSPSKPKNKPFDLGLPSNDREDQKRVTIIDEKGRNANEEEEQHEYKSSKPKERKEDKYDDYDDFEEVERKVIAENEPTTKNIRFKSEHFTLEPNPIMALTHFQGFQCLGKNLLMVDDNSIVYSCGNTICLLDLKSRMQRFFIGQKEAVSCLALHNKQNILVSADNSEKNSQLYLWSLYPQTLQTNFFTGLSNIRCCDIATRTENQKKMLMLLVIGKDSLKRDVIVLYDITNFAHREPEVYCKKISDFDIKSARFIDKRDATQFITCGKESVRFWRLKHKAISGTSMVLNEHGRDTVFNDFCIFNFEDFASTGQTQAESIRGNYKIVFYSDKGNVYLVDYKEETLYGVFKLHQGGITSLNVNPTNHYFITAGEDKVVRLWNMDVTQMLLEVKVDSQVNNLLLNTKDQIICGCLNGTIGELKLDERKMDFVVRSHSDSIIMIDYHSYTKHLVTISRDLTIKVWELKTGHIVQLYEFRCLDEQVTFVRCFHTKPLFVCGFESGSLRVFDLAQSSIVCELDSHNKQVIDIAISPDDKYIVTGDMQGVIQIFDSNLQFLRTIENDIKYQSQTLCFDHYGDYLLTKYNPNTLKIFKVGTWAVCYTIVIQEEIVKASFSPIKHDLFILTSKSQLKKYKLQESTVTMEREYWTMHNGLITDFQISKNANYIFTVGEDNLLKVWDYFMRGKLLPAFQAFTVGGRIREVTLSNDNFNLIFSYGLDNNGIFCWQFYSDFVASVLQEEFEEEEEPVQQEKPKPYWDSMNDRAFEIQTESKPISKAARPLTGEVKSIYHEVEDLLGMPSSTVNLKELQQQRFEEDKEDHYDEFNRRAEDLVWDSINVGHQDYPSQTQQISRQVVDDTMRRKQVTFDEMQPYYYNEENLENMRNESRGYGQEEYGYGYEEPSHKTPANYKMPGQHMSIQSVVGSSVAPGCASVVWNTQDNYITYPLNSSIVITFLEEPKVQKVLSGHHSDEVSFITLSQHNKYLVSASGRAQNEASCNICIWDASKLCFLRNITHGRLQKISSIDVSPCENYVLVLGESSHEEHALVFIWEIQSGSIIANTLYAVPRSRHAKWNTKIKGSLEFTLLAEESITFWRLNHIRSLEYQEAVYDKLLMKGHRFFSLDFLESKLFKDTSFMFVGTSAGSLMVFDTRSNTLLFTCHKFTKSAINHIFSMQRKLSICTEDAGVYSWNLESLSDPEELAKMLDINPDILLVDSKPYCGYFLPDKRGKEGLIATKGGVLWYISWDERATLRLMTSHVSGSTVTALKGQDIEGNRVLISSSTDGTVRVWDAESLEQKSEFYVPRREALCIDIYRENYKCVCGFSDGYVRFFDYEKDINYGGSLLRIDKDDPSKALEDKGFAVTAVCFMKNGKNILAANMNGEVYMIYVKNWENMRIEVRSLMTNIGYAINHITLSELEPWDTWLLSTKNRKVMVWNRKDLSFGKKDPEYYDKLFARINDLEYYLIDNYRVQKKEEKETNYDNFMPESTVAYKYEYPGDTIAQFLQHKPDFYAVITFQLQEVFFRDYKEHMVLKIIKVNGLPRSFILRERENEVIIGTQEGNIKFMDYELGLEKDVVDVSVEGVRNLELCLPKQEFSTSTLNMEPVRGAYRALVCSSRNGIIISKLE